MSWKGVIRVQSIQNTLEIRVIGSKMFFWGAIKKIAVAIFVNPLQAHCSTDPKNNKHRPNKPLQNKRFSVAKQRFKDRGKKVLLRLLCASKKRKRLVI